MKSQLMVPDSSPFEGTGWQLCVIETPAVTLSTYWRDGQPPLAFAFTGKDTRRAACAMIEFLDRLDPLMLRGGTSVPSDAVLPFDMCAMVCGADRRLLRGVVEDDSLLQAFPLYACELQPDGSLPPMTTFVRWTNILDQRRAPQPWFHFRMKGGASRLSVAKWSAEQVSTIEGFVSVLSSEANSWIEIRNRGGQVLRLPDASGWTNALEQIRSHIRRAQQAVAADRAKPRSG
jgi:hypothetical protein